MKGSELLSCFLALFSFSLQSPVAGRREGARTAWCLVWSHKMVSLVSFRVQWLLERDAQQASFSSMPQCRNTQVSGLSGLNVQNKGHLSVLASIWSYFAQRVMYIQLGSEPHVASSLASLCLRSCKHDFLVIVLRLKDVWNRLSLVTIFAKKIQTGLWLTFSFWSFHFQK